MWRRIRSLIRKEFIALLRDPRNRIILIAPPLMQLFVFSLASTLEVKNNAITIWNEDFGTAATELVQRVVSMRSFKRVDYVQDVEAFDRNLDEQRSLLALHIPEDFTAKLARGEFPTIQIIADGRRSNSGQIAVGYVTEVVQRFYLETGYLKQEQLPFTLNVRNWFNPNLDYLWFIIPSLVAILTAVMAMIITALSIARERELGTFDQLLVSPLSSEMILFGKAVPAFLIPMAEASLIMIVGTNLFGVPFEGSLLLLFGAMAAYLFALVGVGLFISALCHTQQQAILGVFCFLLPSVLLSGYASPVDNMPIWLQQLTNLNPLKHFLIISKEIFLKDASPSTVWLSTYPLLIIAVVNMVVAVWMFRRKTD